MIDLNQMLELTYQFDREFSADTLAHGIKENIEGKN